MPLGPAVFLRLLLPLLAPDPQPPPSLTQVTRLVERIRSSRAGCRTATRLRVAAESRPHSRHSSTSPLVKGLVSSLTAAVNLLAGNAKASRDKGYDVDTRPLLEPSELLEGITRDFTESGWDRIPSSHVHHPCTKPFLSLAWFLHFSPLLDCLFSALYCPHPLLPSCTSAPRMHRS